MSNDYVIVFMIEYELWAPPGHSLEISEISVCALVCCYTALVLNNFLHTTIIITLNIDTL